jgi:hypothetical protein
MLNAKCMLQNDPIIDGQFLHPDASRDLGEDQFL